ncbi:MAG: hypothetical protein IRZ11_00320 [Clostridia bacterium]|nr:hypothetical protein [Clostridia bacterium]
MRRGRAGRLGALLALAAFVFSTGGAPARAAPVQAGAGGELVVVSETLVLAPSADGWRALDTATFENEGASAASEVAVPVPGDARDLARLDAAGPAPAVDFTRVLPGASLAVRLAVEIPPGERATVTLSWRLAEPGPFEWTRPVLYPTSSFTALLPREAGRLSAVGLFRQADETIGGRRLQAFAAIDVAEGSLLTIRAEPGSRLRAALAYAASGFALALLALVALRLARRGSARPSAPKEGRGRGARPPGPGPGEAA